MKLNCTVAAVPVTPKLSRQRERNRENDDDENDDNDIIDGNDAVGRN